MSFAKPTIGVESDKANGSVQASYSAFSGSANFGREQIGALGQMMCKSDRSDATAERVTAYASAAISQAAMEAYRN